ncbi:MAG: ankyrin repeat domain-containing protein [Bacilli bacterium]|nr:ankyrin repeat domain-containing protein [Bacilli bacterium]
MNSKRVILSNLARDIRNNSLELKSFKKTLQKALKQGVELNSKIYRGRTILYYAVKRNNRRLVRMLIKSGANPNICDDDFNSPLHHAILMNHFICVKELLKMNVDINIPGEFDQTPLHTAVLKGNLDIIKLLIEGGADIHQVDEKNLTALDYAKDEKDEKIILFLEKSY